MRIERSIEIDRPTTDVFAFISDPGNDPRWCTTVSESHQVEGDGPAQGAVYHQVHKPGPAKPTQLVVELLEVDEPHHMRMRTTDELAEFEVRYELEELDGGRTRLTQVDDTRFRGAARLLQPVMWFAINSGIKRQFRTLKQLLEDASGRDRHDA